MSNKNEKNKFVGVLSMLYNINIFLIVRRDRSQAISQEAVDSALGQVFPSRDPAASHQPCFTITKHLVRRWISLLNTQAKDHANCDAWAKMISRPLVGQGEYESSNDKQN